MEKRVGRVRTGDAGGAVDEDEDHATEGPGDAEEADPAAGAVLLLVADNGGDGDVEEEQGGNEFGDESSVEGPELELSHVKEGSWWWVSVVLPMLLRLYTHFLSHLLLSPSSLSLSLSLSFFFCSKLFLSL